MVVYYSIFAFTCLFAFFGSALKKRHSSTNYISERNSNHDIRNEKSIGLFFAVVSFSLLVFFVGMRTNYVDTSAYIDMFNRISTDFSDLKLIYEEDSEGIGFNFLMMVFKKFVSDNFTVWFMFLAIFQAGAIVSLYYKYSCNYFMSAFIFIANTSFTWMMNGIRQFTAVCIILYFFDYILNKKFLKFFIVILFAMTIHSTAIFWIPVFFIVHFKPWSKQIWICVFLTAVLFFGIDHFTDWLDMATEGTENEGFGTQLTNYGNGTDDGVNILRVAVNAVPAVIALLFRRNTENKSNKLIDICTNLSLVSTGIYCIGIVTSGIMVGRVPIYFSLSNFILLPWLLENVFRNKTQRLIKVLCYVFYFLYFYYAMEIAGAGHYESSILGLQYF